MSQMFRMHPEIPPAFENSNFFHIGNAELEVAQSHLVARMIKNRLKSKWTIPVKKSFAKIRNSYPIIELEKADMIYRRVSARVRQLESKGGNPVFYKRIIDPKSNRSRAIWNQLESILSSKKFTRSKQREIANLLTNQIDISYSAFNSHDTRHAPYQARTIVDIGKQAKELLLKITSLKPGYATDWIQEWREIKSAEKLDIDELVTYGSRNSWAEITWTTQHEIIAFNRRLESLLFGLASLSSAASKHKLNTKIPPKSQLGLVSRKKSRLTLFIVRIHNEIIRIFGKSNHKLTANIASVIFQEAISKNRVKALVKRAKKRGEIRCQK
jgi:hypothetical protein